MRGCFSSVLPCVDAVWDRSGVTCFSLPLARLCEIYSRYAAALTEAFTLVGRPVDEDFGGDDVAKREEHLHEFTVTELLGQVVDEQVAALGS